MDFKITYKRGSGPGGQRKNKVETCVVIIHTPTGLKQTCQDTPSRSRNEDIAMDRLQRAIEIKIYKEKLEKVKEERNKRLKEAWVRKTDYNHETRKIFDNRSKIKSDLKKDLDLLY